MCFAGLGGDCMPKESAVEAYRANASKTHEGLLISSAVDSE